MTPDIEKLSLWKASFVDQSSDVSRLTVELSKLRSKSAKITTQIAKWFPQLTVHDLTHLDALWETADLIAGPAYPMNPLEGFILGAAILLHDSALCFEAYEGGEDAVRETTTWRDAFAIEGKSHPDASDEVRRAAADFAAVRNLHARQAAVLAEQSWKDPDTGDQIFLIEDAELRKQFGQLIGRIAASHHWPIEDVHSGFRRQIAGTGTMPAGWRVDPVKIACLLRCADAAHLDSRRAPDFLHALIRREGISLDHWKAQNWLGRVDVDHSDPSGQALSYTSNRDFTPEAASAWWVTYDSVSLVDEEVRASNELLFSAPAIPSSPPFRARRVVGAGSPEILATHVTTAGWRPTAAKLHVGHVEFLVRTLGGRQLYGEHDPVLPIVLRELIQNARDAIVARRNFDKHFVGLISVSIIDSEDGSFDLCIKDNGVGMSRRVLTGAAA